MEKVSDVWSDQEPPLTMVDRMSLDFIMGM